MTNESILISEVIPATPQRIFSAWMDSAEHSAFTGDEATVVPEVGGEHRAAGGYIQGRTLELNEGARIVQSWRTTEFPPESPDSRVEITLEPTMGGTLVTLLHTDIPVGQGDRYRQGWNEYYLSRLKSYFGDVDQPASTRGAMKGHADADLGLDVDVDVASEVVDLDATEVSEAPTKVVKVPRIAKANAATKPAGLKAKPSSPVAKQAPAKPAAKLTAKSAARPAKKPVKLAASAPAKKAAKTAARRGAKTLRTAAKGAMKSARTAMKRAVKSAKTLMKGVAKSAARKAPKGAKGRAKKPAKAAPSRRAGKKRGASSARSRRR